MALVADNCGLYSEETVVAYGQKQTAVKSPLSTAVQKVSCPQCSKRMLPVSLRSHKRLVHGPHLLANCTVCRKSLRQRHMKQHMQLHSGKKVSCDTCGMQFLRGGNLERHEKTIGACEQYKYKLSLAKQNALENRLKDEEWNGEEKFCGPSKSDCRGCFDTIVIDWIRYRVYSPEGSSSFDPAGSIPLAKARTIYGVEDEHQWHCRVTGCQFVVTKPTLKFDLHLVSKHIDGGLRWYCGDLKCKQLSWCGMNKKSIRNHVERVHPENVEETWRKCVLLHPKTLDDHLQSRKDLKSTRLPFDSMPWIDRKTQEPVHPEVIEDISFMIMRKLDSQENFKCYHGGCTATYEWMGDFIAHELSLHWNFTMTCPIGCGTSLDDFRQVRDHFDKIHGKLVDKKQRGSEVTDAKSMNAFLTAHVFEMSDFARTVKTKIETDPNAVFFIDIETSIPFTGVRPEPIEISVVDGNGTIIVDTIIDYGLTVAEMFKQYSTPKVFDRRFYTLVKVLGHPSNNRITGLNPTEIVQALRKAGMNESSILIDWSMCRFDWFGLRRIMEIAGDVSCLPTKSNCWGILREWKTNMPGLCCRLEDLFPLVFPEDILIGKNHRSLPDTRMLWKMTFRFFQLVAQRSGGKRDDPVGVFERVGEMGGYKMQGDAST